MSAMEWNMDAFNQQVGQVQELIGRNARSYVRTTARRLIRRLAWAAPHASLKYSAAGRLRAGFWTAAAALGITNIYTRFPNKGEGDARDATHGNNPSFTITNSVPYVLRLKQGQGWIESAAGQVRSQMARDLMKYAEDSWARRDLVEDLTGE